MSFFNARLAQLVCRYLKRVSNPDTSFILIQFFVEPVDLYGHRTAELLSGTKGLSECYGLWNVLRRGESWGAHVLMKSQNAVQDLLRSLMIFALQPSPKLNKSFGAVMAILLQAIVLEAARIAGVCSRFVVFPGRIRPPCTTMPWTIWPALVVLWGVCWMFYWKHEAGLDSDSDLFAGWVWEDDNPGGHDPMFDEQRFLIPTADGLADVSMPNELKSSPAADTWMLNDLDYDVSSVTSMMTFAGPSENAVGLAGGPVTPVRSPPLDAFSVLSDGHLPHANTNFRSTAPPQQLSSSAAPQAPKQATAPSHASATVATKATTANTRLTCTIGACATLTPPPSFTRKADLDRHKLSRHAPATAKRHYCPHASCKYARGGRAGGFARRDGLDKHVGGMHGASAVVAPGTVQEVSGDERARSASRVSSETESGGTVQEVAVRRADGRGGKGRKRARSDGSSDDGGRSDGGSVEDLAAENRRLREQVKWLQGVVDGLLARK